MKRPPIHFDSEEDLAQFVVAADSGQYVRACDLLFVNGADLSWSGAMVLIDLIINPDFEDDFHQKLQLINTRVGHSTIPLMRLLIPALRQAHGTFPGDSDSAKEGREREVVTSLTSMMNSPEVLTNAGGLLFSNSQLIADVITNTLVSPAMALRDRVIRGSGFSEDSYDEMIEALVQSEIAEGPVFQIGIPPGQSYPEISFSGPKGLRVTTLHDHAHSLAIYGLNSRVADQRPVPWTSKEGSFISWTVGSAPLLSGSCRARCSWPEEGLPDGLDT